MPSKPTIDELWDSRRFLPVFEISHARIVEAVQPLLFSRSPVTVTYWLLNLACLIAVGIGVFRAPAGRLSAFSLVCLGMVTGFITLLPIHEWLHALAYRAVGARRVSIRYEPRRLTAMCIADLEVVGAGAFVVVALVPFLFINAGLMAAVAASAGTLRLLFLGALFFHLGGCSGDIALVNLVWRHRGTGLVTYDDHAAGRSFFFQSIGTPAADHA